MNESASTLKKIVFIYSKTVTFSVSASGSSQEKVYVTMVGWTQNDQYVVIAVSDLTLKVCSSYTGQLVHVLKVCVCVCVCLIDHGLSIEVGRPGAKTINVFRACLGAQLTICAQK